MTDQHHHSATARGFSGLTALASTISAEPVIMPPQPLQPPIAAARQENVPFVPEVRKPGFWTGSRKMWAVVIAGICVVAYVNSTPSTPTYSGAGYAPSQSTNRTPSPAPQTLQAPRTSSPSEPMKVPIATPDQVLSQGEIKYCLAERARLEAMKLIIDERRQTHITNFNYRVGDYNARCSSYRYRQADMNSAQAEIEAMRGSLQTQAAEQVRAWP